MISPLPGGIDDTAPTRKGEPNPFADLIAMVEGLVTLYEDQVSEVSYNLADEHLKTLEAKARGRGIAAVDHVKGIRDRLTALKEAAEPKPVFPLKTTIYLHNDKESNWSKAAELGLKDEAARTFAYTALEVDLTIQVEADGQATATHFNGIALERPAKL